MSWSKRILMIVAGGAVLAVLVWAFMPQPVEVELGIVTRGPFTQTIDEDGKTRVRDRYVISAPLSGRLMRITWKEGDNVDAGTSLAYISPSPPALLDVRTEQELKARVGSAEAAKLRALVKVERAKVALEQAKADLERTRKLAKEGFVSPTKLEADELVVKLNARELDTAIQEDHVAAHDIDVARAALLQVRNPGRTELSRTWGVSAPIKGRVLRVLQQSEGMVNVGTPLLEIADPKNLEVVVDVLSTDAVRIAPAAKVLFERWGGNETLEGRVRLVEPSAFTKVSALGVEEQRVNVLIDIVSPTDRWTSVGDGYRVEAKIVVDRRDNAVKVPVSALFRDGDNWAVFVVADGRATKRLVQSGPRSGQDAVVEKGLEPGDLVIIYPSDAVKGGAKIKVRRTA